MWEREEEYKDRRKGDGDKREGKTGRKEGG